MTLEEQVKGHDRELELLKLQIAERSDRRKMLYAFLTLLATTIIGPMLLRYYALDNKAGIDAAAKDASAAKIQVAEVKESIPKVAEDVKLAIEQRDPVLDLAAKAGVANAKSWNAYNTKLPEDVNAAAAAVQTIEAMAESLPTKAPE